MQAARLMLVVVFPQPPFWLMIATVRMPDLPWFRETCARQVVPSTKNEITPDPAELIGPVREKTLGL